MSEKRKGVCIQIGLDFTAEMNYLSRDDWKDQIGNQVVDKRIPEISYKDIESWRFIGVDSNQDSVDRLSEQYPKQEFICADIKIGSDLKKLMEDNNIDSIDVLVMDLEGEEYNVLNSYNKDILPKFLSVECHRWHHNEQELLDMYARHNLQGFATDNNMALFRVIPTNQEYEFPTIELQYIKQESANIEIKEYDKLRIHMVGRPHTMADPSFNACAFQMKDLRFEEAMSKRGHDIFYYGNVGGKTFGEHIDVVPSEVYMKHYSRNVNDRK